MRRTIAILQPGISDFQGGQDGMIVTGLCVRGQALVMG